MKKKARAARAAKRVAEQAAEDSNLEKGTGMTFSVTNSNSQGMGRMADKKAQILIRVNAILISAIISLASDELNMYSLRTIPILVLLATNLAALVAGILATRPSVTHGRYMLADLEQHKVNLLFFGHYSTMPPGDYEKGMFILMNDAEMLREMMAMDLYYQGKAVGNKFRLLKIAYTIFILGLVAALVVFITVALVPGL